MKKSNGGLIIVATPIGNLGDITLRAKDALERSDAIYAEDTRVTSRLLSMLGIRGEVCRLDENVMTKTIPEVIERVVSGELIAYCSDAGMPGVSDPGMRLVSAARDAGVNVEVLPGASAVVTAYVASGVDEQCFYFGGFLPKKESQRINLLQSLSYLDAALIFYESPKRLVSSLESVARVFPYRKVAVCRELTKIHEEVVLDSALNVFKEFKNRESCGAIKGEIVIVISGSTGDEDLENAKASAMAAESMAAKLIGEGCKVKEVAKLVSKECGIPRNEAYEIALAQNSGTDRPSCRSIGCLEND